MFLILTPTRVLITDVKGGMSGFRPVLDSPILTLLRGDAEATAVQDDDGLWLYHLKSRAQSAELELELASSGRGIAAELAGQLQEFSITQPVDAKPGSTALPEPIVASQMLDPPGLAHQVILNRRCVWGGAFAGAFRLRRISALRVSRRHTDEDDDHQLLQSRGGPEVVGATEAQSARSWLSCCSCPNDGVLARRAQHGEGGMLPCSCRRNALRRRPLLKKL
jgi:hypothetical protein